MKKIIIDLDNTITLDDANVEYIDKRPNLDLIKKLREYKVQGFEIAIFTARNMRTYEGSIGHINANTLPTIISWLNRHDVPFDEVHVGKPWCGDVGFYVDDKAIRPSEFLSLSHSQILTLLDSEGDKLLSEKSL